MALALGSRPAAAQMAGRLGLQSDYVVRGASVTQNRPTAGLDLSYDFPAGVYVNGSAFGALPTDGRLGFVGLIGDVGYAKRLNLQVSVDGGVTRTEYVNVGRYGSSTGYTEIYGGLSARHLSGRLYFSPDYYHSGARTLYGEVGGNIGFLAGIRLNAHLGALEYLEQPRGLPPARPQYDWLVGASRQLGPFDLHVAVSGGAPNQPFLYYQAHPKTQAVVGAGYTF